MVSCQMLSELEEVIQYKLVPERRDIIKETWWERLQVTTAMITGHIHVTRSSKCKPDVGAAVETNGGTLHTRHRYIRMQRHAGISPPHGIRICRPLRLCQTES